jgi:hypothetical protein
MFKRRGPRADGQRRLGDRRTSKRQPAGWEGRYRVVDAARRHLHYAGDDYESCVLTDLSLKGAGLHVLGGHVAVGDRVELDLPLGADRRARIQVQGEVRHASAGDGNPPRAGLEFVDVGDLEHALLLRLLRNMGSSASRSA